MLAVYTAGYVRTQSAAQKFTDDAGGRKPRAQPDSLVAATSPTPSPGVALPISTPAEPTPTPALPETIVPPTAPEPSAPAVTSSVAIAPAVTGSPIELAAATETAAVPAPPPVAVATPTPVAVAAVGPASATASTSAKAATTPPVAAAPSKWRDGKFTGWGSCRHGDIEATVEIRGGRIVSAVISKCHTVYSCDVIAKVIPQVVERQTPDVDTVSGATQSADAFYWAVFSALADAAPEPLKTK